MNSEPKLYEISYVLKIDTEEALGNTLEQIRKYIEERSGRSLEERHMSKRRLAYPVGKNHEGFFGSIKFFLKPEDLGELESKLKSDKHFIRYIITIDNKYGAEPRGHVKKIRRVSEQKAADIQEIDKKLEEILGQ